MPEDEAEAVAETAQQTPPCAGCRTLRRRCVPGCVFAPYFPADDGGGGDPSAFAAVHRVFGASNAARMLADVDSPDDRRRAAETLVEEARARLRDPALGCLSYVAVLQMLNDKARQQVAAARAEIAAEFGDEAAAVPVDVAAAAPEVRAEAKEQAGRALEYAREQDAKLLAARRAADLEWWQQHRHAAKHAGEGPGGRRRKKDTNEKLVAKTENTAAGAGAGESSSEQTMVTAAAVAGTEMLAPAEKQEPPAEATREEALATEKAPAAAPPRHHDSAATTQLAGAGTGFLDGDQWAASEALAKRLDTIKRLWAAGKQCHGDPAAARQAAMGLDVTADAQEVAVVDAVAAEAASGQDLMVMLAAADQGMVMQLLAAGAAQYGNLAAQYDDDVALLHGQQDIRQQMTVAAAAAAVGEVAGEQGMAVRHAAAAQIAAQEMMQLAASAQQYGQTELDVTLGQAIAQQMVQAQQLAGAAKVDGEQDIIPPLVATAEVAGEQGIFMQQVAAALQNPVAQYSETELGISLGPHQPTVQEIFQEQQLADAAGVAVYADGEHGSDSGGTVAFLPVGLGEAVPFLFEQQPQPQGQMAMAPGLQLDSSLPPLPPSLGQPHAQVSQQKSTDGGDEGQSSDLTAYVYY